MSKKKLQNAARSNVSFVGPARPARAIWRATFASDIESRSPVHPSLLDNPNRQESCLATRVSPKAKVVIISTAVRVGIQTSPLRSSDLTLTESATRAHKSTPLYSVRNTPNSDCPPAQANKVWCLFLLPRILSAQTTAISNLEKGKIPNPALASVSQRKAGAVIPRPGAKSKSIFRAMLEDSG